MGDPHIATLLYPFVSGHLVPAAGTRVVCYGIGRDVPDFDELPGKITYVQGFRPFFLELREAGRCVLPTIPEDETFDIALIRLGRHRGQNETWIAEAVCHVCCGGSVVLAGGKTDGVSSLRRRLSAVIDVGHRAIGHGEAVWFEVPADRKDVAARLPLPESKRLEGRYETAAGMFSHAHIDPGSKLLASFLPTDLEGSVADFGAGWGYLSVQALERCPSIASMSLFEADFASLQAARSNLAGYRHVKLDFHWLDLLREPLPRRYDVVIMNPPFHIGRAAEPDIGRSMIARSADALHSGGRLFMVANRKLPYEGAIEAHFSRTWQRTPGGGYNGYKVIEAIR